MNRLYLIVVCVLVSCLGCQSKITDMNIKIEIVSWWNNPDIDDVFITDLAQYKNTAKVSAMLIVLDDTLREFIYKFEKFQKSWKIIEGPDDMLRSLLSSYVDELKLNKLKANMHTLQLTVEDFSMRANDKYPKNFTIKVKEIFPNCQPDDSSFSVMDDFIQRLCNPYNRNKSAVFPSKKHPWDWSLDYVGKAVYFPMGKKNNYATAYIIKGSTDKKFISLVLKSSNVKSWR